MDLILTGRAVGAEEALRMGLANRVVPAGEEREAAEELAAGIARFPQTCLRQDRLSALAQHGLSEEDAIAVEWRHGMNSPARFPEPAVSWPEPGAVGHSTTSTSATGGPPLLWCSRRVTPKPHSF